MKFRLSEEDATRLDCPRDVEFDPEKLMGRELIAMEKQTGWSFELLQRNMQGKPVKDALGNQLYEVDENGDDAKDEAGNRIRVIGLDVETALIICWLGARRAKGGDIPWSEFDIDIAKTEFDSGEDEGKAPPKAASTSTRRATRAGTRTTKRR